MKQKSKSIIKWIMTIMLTVATVLGALSLPQFIMVARADDEPENIPPSVMGIPGETIDEGKRFAPIKLDKYVTDEDDAANIMWSVSGNKELIVSISSERVATIEIPSPYWNGSEDITFIATDSKGASGSETVKFNVESVNNPPEVRQIPDQTINEGGSFDAINLDDYVSDVDHNKDLIDWECDITPIGKTHPAGDLMVEIDPNRVASVIIPDPNWYGSVKIKFTATDGEYASASVTANFVVIPINDVPRLKKIPDQTIEEKNEFESFSLTDYVVDEDDDVSQLEWTVSGNEDLIVSISRDYTATIETPNQYWNGSEKVTFTVTDPAGASATTTVSFTVVSVNDPPVVQKIPDQTIGEGETFAAIDLDNYVIDPDHQKNEIHWGFEITPIGNGQAEDDLTVEIDGNRVARVIIPNPQWYGSANITFTATDPDGDSDYKTATFVVMQTTEQNPTYTKPSFTRHALLLSDEIGVQFYVSFPDGFDGTGCYVDFAAADGRSSTMQYADAVPVEGSSNVRYFSFNINALELAENITATMHYGENETVADQYSAMTYIQAVQDDTSAAADLKNLVNALQAYGYYMQQSGWTDDKASHTAIPAPADGLTTEQVTAAQTAVSGMNKTVTGTGLADTKVSLTLNAKTMINVYVKPEEGVTIPSGGCTTETIGGETYYKFTTDKIGPKNLATPYSVTVETSSGTATVSASAMSYVNAAFSSNTLSEAQQKALAAYYYYYDYATQYN